MTDLDVPPEPPARLPTLADDALRALPARRPVLLAVLGALVALGSAVGLTLLAYPESSVPARTAERVQQLAVSLAPWVVAAPWLRYLDLRRVPWFFLCLLGPLGGFVLAGVVGYRALSLPYRTWSVGFWHEHRARRIAGTRSWVLLDGAAVPQPDLSPRARFWDRCERAAWVVMAGSAATFQVWRDPLDSYVGGFWFACLLALALGPYVVTWVLRSRAENPRP